MRFPILLFLSSLLCTAARAQQSTPAGSGMLPVREGPDAVYIFLPTPGAGPVRVTALERSVGGRSRTRTLPVPAFAAPQSRFEETAGDKVLPAFQKSLGLASTAEAYARIKADPDPAKWGFAAANIRFLQALGAVAMDKDAAREDSGTEVTYRATFTDAGGKTSTAEGSVRIGTPPALTRLAATRAREFDSSVTATWTGPVQGNEDAFAAVVYRQSANAGDWVEAGRVMAVRDDAGSALAYTFNESVAPMQNHRYYVVPVTYTGLRGPASDTVVLTSRDIRRMPALSLRTARDTAGGIALRWDAVEETDFGAALLLERADGDTQLFAVLDTLVTTETAYTDGRALPGTTPLYRIRYLSARGDLSDPSNSIKAVREGRDVRPAAPTGLRVLLEESVARATWRSGDSAAVLNYLLYRSPADRDDWQLVSNRTESTETTDTLRDVPNGTYRYRVEAVSSSDVQSGAAEEALVQWRNPADRPAPPIGLTGYADGIRAVLHWHDSREYTPGILGYRVYYRSSKGAGWQRISDTVLMSASATAGTGPGAAYAVSSVATDGLEGEKSDAFVLDAPAPYAVPAVPFGVSARATGAGIVVEWGAVLDEGLAGYEIFRRAEGSEERARIGETAATDDTFTDATASAGELYFYSVAAKGTAGVGEYARSLEVGARR